MFSKAEREGDGNFLLFRSRKEKMGSATQYITKNYLERAGKAEKELMEEATKVR